MCLVLQCFAYVSLYLIIPSRFKKDKVASGYADFPAAVMHKHAANLYCLKTHPQTTQK